MINISKTMKRLLVFMLTLAMVCPVLTYTGETQVKAATATVSSVKVTNLPANKLTLSKGKMKVLNVSVATTASSVSKAYTYQSSNTKVATVSKATGGVLVKAVAKGTSTITITSKANKAKKAVVYVTVGTPVTSVKLNKTSATIYKGSTLTLSKTIAPSTASNKTLVWTSSNTTVATVSSSGKITAKKAGVATIKATAADGSGKYASCKVTVKNPNAISAIKVINGRTIKVSLSYAQSIPEANWAVKGKDDKGATYKEKKPIEYVKNVDNKVYYINLKSEYVQTYEYIQVLVKGLAGCSGYKSKETRFESTSSTVDSSYYERFTMEYGCFYRMYLVSGKYYSVTMDKLPKGIKVEYDDYSGKFYLVGTPLETGKFKGNSMIKDAYGLVSNSRYEIIVGSNNKLVVSDYKVYGTVTEEDYYYGEMVVNATGGSGNYAYEIVSNPVNAFFADSEIPKMSFTIQKEGTYTIKVKVTDKNTGVSSTASYIVILKKLSVLNVVVKDADGNVPNSNHIEVVAVNRDTSAKYTQEIDLTMEDGVCKGYLEKGTYDIYAYIDNVYRASHAVVVSDNNKIVNITVPVYKVTLKTTANQEELENAYWVDKYGNYAGYSDILYLKKGDYELTSRTNTGLFKLNIGVTKSATFDVHYIENIVTTSTKKVLVSGEYDYTYKFVPEKTGKYLFKSYGINDPSLTILDEESMELAYDDDTNGTNYRIECDLEAGKTYYLEFYMYNSSNSNVGLEYNLAISIEYRES